MSAGVAEPHRVLHLGVELTRDAIRREAQYHPADSFEAAERSATEALAVRALLEGEARREGLLASDAGSESVRDEAVQVLLDREVPVPEVTSEACETFYVAHSERLRTGALAEISHILIAARPGEPDELASARTRAQDLLTTLRERPERFEALARAHSACPSGASGGSLGQLRPGEVDAEIERVCARLTPGEIAPGLVETAHGVHLVRLDAKATGQVPPFEAVRDRIEIYLRDRAWRQSLKRYVGRLACVAQAARERGGIHPRSEPGQPS